MRQERREESLTERIEYLGRILFVDGIIDSFDAAHYAADLPTHFGDLLIDGCRLTEVDEINISLVCCRDDPGNVAWRLPPRIVLGLKVISSQAADFDQD